MKSLTSDQYVQEYLRRNDPKVKEIEPKTQEEAQKPKPKEPKFKPVWQSRLDELKTFFNGTTFHQEIKLNCCTTISNPSVFIETHLSIIDNNNGNPWFIVYLERLELLKEIIKHPA